MLWIFQQVPLELWLKTGTIRASGIGLVNAVEFSQVCRSRIFEYVYLVNTPDA